MMRSFFLQRSALAFGLCVLLAACATTTPTVSSGGQNSKSPVVIGLSFDILNNIRQAEKTAFETKIRELGGSVEFVVADNDGNRQVSQIDSLLARKVNAIVAIAQDKDAIVAGVQKANAAGVPFITLDRAISPGGEVAFHISADPYSDGRVAAQYMAYTAAAKAMKLRVFILVGGLSDSNAVERNRGFKDEIARWPNISVVAEAKTDWKPEQALAATKQTLAAHADMNAIFCPSDFLLPSVLSAMDEAGRSVPPASPNHIMLVSIDGDPFGFSKTADSTISADVATLADVLGARAAEVAVQAAHGQKLATNREVVPGLLFTTSNAQQVAKSVWGANSAP